LDTIRLSETIQRVIRGEKTESDTQVLQEAMDLFYNDIGEFGLFFFPHLLNLTIPEFHREIYGLLPNNRYLAIAAPRGHAKTTLEIVYCIWHALFKKIGDVSIMSLSEDFVLREITGRIKKEFEINDLLRLFFGDQKTSKWTESYFRLANGIAFEGGGITGQLRGGRRGLIALDDLESNETVASDEQRNKLRERISRELLPKLLPNGQMIYFGTLINQLSYLNSIVSTPDNGWERRIYDCYKDGIEGEGHELWQEMLPHSELQDRKKKMGSNAFSSEYRNKPVSDESQPIKEEQIRYWTELPTQLSLVISVDPAYSEDSSADYKTASLIGIDQNANRYLISYIRNHDPLGEFQDSIINLFLSNKGNITAVGIPNSGVEKAFFDSFLKKCEQRKVFEIPIQEVKNSFTNTATQVSVRNKTSRITAALQPLFEQGKYYINSNHIEARDELLSIGVSKHDDICDTMCYAEQLLQIRYFGDDKPSYDTREDIKEYSNYGM